MEAHRTGSQTTTLAASSVYERWEEVYVSSDKGKREVHYFLKRRNGDGGLDLAVVGKEKTLRHMSYHYAFNDREQRFLLPKLRSRREVIDWLNSVVNPELQPHQSVKSVGTYMASREANNQDSHVVKNLKQCSKEVMWLGSPWTCRKRRRHYQSFCRNGVEIAVHDFVYVLAEEDERLVAHLDDMYEDTKGNKMVVVRWFHKIDEVGVVLPQSYRDREIFFSLCLQDLSIECIDGLATVLSPQHYEQFLNGAKHTQLEPFVCHRQFDNDEIKAFDVTQLKGYWKQDLLRYTCPVDDGLEVERNPSDAAANRPKKRLRWSEECDTNLQSASEKVDVNATLQSCNGSLTSSKVVMGLCRLRELSAASFGNIKLEKKNSQHLSIGSQVEVLSQDSGIRGCWFRAFIVKKHKEKVKVRYQDIMDATDEAQNLEEWILASRLAAPDELGVRICGRSIVRPVPWTNKGKVSWVFNVGTLVDVWRHDGWWEGIVVKKESEDRLHVYFPGERQELIFGCGDLRHSQEWLEDGWKQLKERSDLVSVLSGLEIKQDIANCGNVKPEKAVLCYDRDLVDNSVVDMGDEKLNELKVMRDLSKDDLLSQLRWKSSGRRRRSRSPVHKLQFGVHDNNKRVEDSHKQTYRKYFGLPLKVDPDNCKYRGDSSFGSSIVSPLSNLVMTR
ncbi:uncharacterized protein LOC113753249 isoform X1 [Coffea eugenioides]|uniref:uncharacterized protein LOC113753249 isoform X1 n=2 Tax=Coffea eugenioides TaxID=49369 RepID=UPI000F614E62|nr:uncharacterized protein LOC113753249 isoform X1 [Coffea eugenioides]